MLKKIRLFFYRLRYWPKKPVGVAEWWQEENVVHLKIQRCGLLKNYVGIPFYCDIDIDPEMVVQRR